ncbi:MAG: pyruvate kinase [Deltaproteobacteria bacterium]|nr:MAG: pyruvate kinase [Deltaproteobacteria bacterium]
MPHFRKTRIVATIGPASREPAVLTELLRAGVDVCRVNCSHATADSIRSDVARIRRASARLGRPVAILLDLQGPKIRTGGGDPVRLRRGDTLTVVMDEDRQATAHEGGAKVGTTWPSLSQDVRVGERVLFADGALFGEVIAVRDMPEGEPDEVDIRILDGGELGPRKGINLPDTDVRAPALTDKDRADLAVGVDAGVDYVAISFVRRARDVVQLRELLESLGAADMPVIAKIEKPQAVAAIDAILQEADGIMVARGDLGVETPLEQVPIVQKSLIAAANRRNRLVITATQMLDSMERNARPTRAEVTDVANAIVDGTDAVMLSGETATGRYPIRAVEVMDRIARAVEPTGFMPVPDLDRQVQGEGGRGTVTRAACYAVRDEPRPLMVFTWSGRTAIMASKSRPPKPIFAFSPDPRVCDRLCLVWGVLPLSIPGLHTFDELIAAAEKHLLERGLMSRGEQVVVVAGDAPIRGGNTLMKVETVDGRSGGLSPR